MRFFDILFSNLLIYIFERLFNKNLLFEIILSNYILSMQASEEILKKLQFV